MEGNSQPIGHMIDVRRFTSELVRGVGFEPTKAYATGSLIHVTTSDV